MESATLLLFFIFLMLLFQSLFFSSALSTICGSDSSLNVFDVLTDRIIDDIEEAAVFIEQELIDAYGDLSTLATQSFDSMIDSVNAGVTEMEKSVDTGVTEMESLWNDAINEIEGLF